MKKDCVNNLPFETTIVSNINSGQFDLLDINLADLLDISRLQQLFELQYKINKLTVGLIDNEGNILASAGWQDICLTFHRAHPETKILCTESDTQIKSHLGKNKYSGYKCRLGLWDYAVPLMVAGKHLGNLFFGQFFFEDDEEDTVYFRAQAKEYGFDESKYLEALNKVPRLSREKVELIMEYYSGLVDMIADQAYKNLLVQQEKNNRQLLSSIYNGADMPMFLISVGINNELHFLSINEAHEKLTGMKCEEISGKTPEQLTGIPDEAKKMVRCRYEECLFSGKSIKYREMIPMKGRDMHWLTTLTPLFNEQGRIFRIVGTSMHINQMVETQQELERHKNDLEQLVKERTQALSLSEKQCRIVFEDSPVGISQTGIDGSLRFNKALTKIFGYTEKELREKNWKDLTHPDDLRESEEMVQGLLARKKDCDHIEKRYLRKNGHYFWADVHTSLHRNDDGTPLFFITTVSDITNRKMMELQVKKSEEKYRSLFNNIMDGLVITNGRIINDCNETLLKMFGYEKEEVLNQPTSKFYASQEDFETMGQALNDHEKEGNFFIQVNFRTKSGKVFPGETGVFYIKDSEGNVIDVIGMVRDISDRKITEKALEQSEEKHRAIFESATDAFIIADEKGVVVEVNPSACKIYGYSYDEMIGRAATGLIHPDHHFRFPEMVRVLKEQGHYEGETVDIRKDGTTFFTEIYGSTIKFHGKNHILVIVRDVSQQKEASLKLEQEKKFTDTVMNAMPGLFYVFDKNGKYIKWNKAVENLTGFTAQELNCKSPMDFVAPYHREKISHALQEAMKKGSNVTEADFVMKDETIPFLVTGNLLEQNGEPLIIGVGIDITKRVKAEKERERVLRDLNERIKEMTCLYGINELFRRESRNLHGLLQDTVRLIPSGWQNPEYTGAEIGFDNIVVNTSGPLSSHPFLKENIVINDKIRGYIKVFVHVVEPERLMLPFIEEEKALLREIAFNLSQFIDRLVYEKAIRESEENLKNIIHYSPVPKLVINRDNKVEFANNAFLKAMGYRSGELNDFETWWLNAVPDEEYRNKITAEWNQALLVAGTENRTSDPIEVRLASKKGEARIFSIVCSSLTDKIIAVLTDLTERVEAEEKLRKLLADLRRSNEELEQFAYVASHDLQEPLRMVSSYTQMLERRYKGQLDDKADKYIHYAVDGAKRMQTLINDLLEFSRISTRGRAFEAVNCNDVVKSVVNHLDIKIQEKTASITFTLLPQLQADPSQIERLFLNLINNALKFQKPGNRPVIQISAREQNDQWLFMVKDNGIGIEAEYKEKIFVIFQKLHNSEEYPGTGIGLAICKRIIERHGGNIWFKSRLGEGTTFYFSLKK